MELLTHFAQSMRRVLTVRGDDLEGACGDLRDMRLEVPRVPKMRASWATPFLALAIQMEILQAIERGDVNRAARYGRILTRKSAEAGLVDYPTAMDIEQLAQRVIPQAAWEGAINNSTNHDHQGHGQQQQRASPPSPSPPPPLCLYDDDVMLGRVQRNIKLAAAQLSENGYAVVDALLGPPWAAVLPKAFEQMAHDMENHFTSGELELTGQSHKKTRGDKILWLDGLDAKHPLPSQLTQLLQKTVGAVLSSELNQRGEQPPLADTSGVIADSMFAMYSPCEGGFVRHLDNAGQDDLRRVSAVYYLSDCSHGQGGELVLYPESSEWDEEDTNDEEGAAGVYCGKTKNGISVVPRIDRLVLFWSNKVPHEVIALTEDAPESRMALSYWYRSRLSSSMMDEALSPLRDYVEGHIE